MPTWMEKVCCSHFHIDPLHQPPATRRKPRIGKTYLKSEREYVTNRFINWVEAHLKREN